MNSEMFWSGVVMMIVGYALGSSMYGIFYIASWIIFFAGICVILCSFYVKKTIEEDNAVHAKVETEEKE